MLTDLIYRLRALVRRRRVEDELQQELQYHLEREIEKYRESGFSPDEAKRRANLAVGGFEQLRQQCREARGTRLIDDLVHDLRFAVRQLRRSPAFTVTAVLVFALGIAASAAIFAFVDAALIKPLPYRDPSRLVALFEGLPVGERYHLSYPDYISWKTLNQVFSSIDVYRPEHITLKTATGSEVVSGASISDGFFRTLGVAPFLGRDFRPGEDQPHAPATVILSYRTWHDRLGGDPAIVGRTVVLEEHSYLVIGVMPSRFDFAPVEPAEFWRPIGGFCADNRVCHPYYGVARLKQGVSVAAALADLTTIARQIAIAYPASNRDRSATVIPLTDAIIGNIRPTLVVLLSGAALLSMIGFINIFSLFLVRAESRRREIAVRGALGASHVRLIRQFAVEGFLLAGAGGVLGLTLAYGSIRLLLGLIPRQLLATMPYLEGLHSSWHLLLVVLIITALGGGLFTVAPAMQLFLTNMQTGLTEGGRSAADRSWRRIGASLVVVELAITVVMMTSAGLLAKSFYRLLHEDIGISPDHLSVLRILKVGNSNDVEQIALEREILLRVAALPGVTSAGISEELAINDGEMFKMRFAHFRVFGRYHTGEGDEAVEQTASTGYFETLRARLITGRYFTEADDASKPRVAIINKTMANQYFPGEEPLRKRIVNEYDQDHPIEIIGVIDDLKDGPLDMTPTPAVYRPFNQSPSYNFYVTVRSSGSEQTVLQSMVTAVHQIDPGLIADGEDTMTNRINSSQSAYLHRSAASIVAGFAALSLILGTVGLYGVVAYSVGRRTREIGVRMALGAQRTSIYKLILQEAAWLAVSGLAGGILTSMAVAGALNSMLFGIGPRDMGTLLSVACVLVAASLLASYLPARRAASIHPTEALRAE